MNKSSLMCTRKEFLHDILDILVNINGWCFLGWTVPDEMGNKQGSDIFMFQSCIAVINYNFWC